MSAVAAVKLTAPSVNKKPAPTDVPPAVFGDRAPRWFVLVLSEVGDPAVPSTALLTVTVLAVVPFQTQPTAW